MNFFGSGVPVTPTASDGKDGPEEVSSWMEADDKEMSLEKKYWRIDGKYYDLTPFLDKHPGGKELLLIARDRFEDCTYAFEAHHHDYVKVRKILATFEVTKAAAEVRPVPIQFPTLAPDDSFYSVLRKRVKVYLDANGGSGPTTECIILWWCCVAGFVGCYSLAWRTGYLFWAIIQGILGGWIGGFGHNWIHQPKYRGYAHIGLDALGLSSEAWLREHIFNHHMFTNTPRDNHWSGTAPFLIVNPGQKRNSCQIFIGLALWPLTLALGVYGNFLIHTTGLLKGREKFSWSKFIFVFEYLFLAWKWGWLWGLALNAGATMTVSFYYFTIALTNHNTEDAWDVDEQNKAKDWGERQLTISTDICTQWSFLQSILFLWLNYHTVHHLFPHTDMSKHPGIQKILLKTAQEFGLRYSYSNSFADMISQMMTTFTTVRHPGYVFTHY